MTTKLNKAEQAKLDKDGLDVLADLYRYSQSGDYDAIEADDLEIRFKWFGVYRQRPNDGHFMFRLKIPGGQLTPAQLEAIAELTDRYARGFGDITTRQDIQLHWITMADIGPIFDKLRELGMSSQFACGDTPRNVVSCPLSGVVENEIIDATQAVLDVNQLFLEGGKEFSNLPRKFKASLAGCPIHCHQPQINDLGFYGVKRSSQDGQVDQAGYGLLLGGGLSSTPHYAQPLRVFVRPEQVTEVARAAIILFRDHGYREKRTRARLKFLVADKGWQWTRDTLESILGYELEHDESLGHPPALHDDHMGVGPQKDGCYYVGVPIGRGRLTARNMSDLATLARRHAQGSQRIRLTAKQNVLILDVPRAHVEPLVQDLTQAGLSPHAHALRTTLVACTGTEFCNLAIAETKHRAGRILHYLEQRTELDQPLFISVTGCPNACAQYQIADIGLTGTLADDPQGRKDERGKPVKVDAFNVLLGGCLGRDPRFGEVIAKKVVADRVHLAIENLVNHYLDQRLDEDESFPAWCGRSEPEYLQKLILEPTQAPDAVSLTI